MKDSRRFWVLAGCTVVNLLIAATGPEDVGAFATFAAVMCCAGMVAEYLVERK